jgi:hypothetical protein
MASMFSYLTFASFGLLAACSGSSGGTGTAVTDKDSGSTVPTVTQTGTIVDFDANSPIAGAAVTDGTHTATTASDGTYSLEVDQGVAFTMTVTSPKYVTLMEQQTTLTADAARGQTQLVSLADEPLLQETLTGYDATLGVLSVAVVTTGSCMTGAGATLSVSPAGNSRITYMDHKIPNSTLTSVQDGQFPSAVIYNLPTDVPVTVTVQGGSCTEAPFPVEYIGMSFSSDISTMAGEVTSFQRLFLQ